MENSLGECDENSQSRSIAHANAIDLLFIAPHLRKNQKAGTYDGVSKYSSELISAINTNPAKWRTATSNVSSSASYYIDAVLGYSVHRSEVLWRSPRLVHTLDWYVPILQKGVPHIATVHDLVMLEWRRGAKRLKARIFTQALLSADHYIAISNSVSEALRTQLGIDESRISVVHHGINPIYLNENSVEDYEKSIDIVFVSNIAHRKNIRTLLCAIERLTLSGKSVSVVIVGRILEEDGEVLGRLSRLQKSGVVRLCSGLSERDLAQVYARSRVFVSSSLAEGFGMPVLEAMASGIPLLLSDIPIYRELAAGYANFFPAMDDERLANLLLALLGDESRRLEEGRRNRSQGHSFSWPACAEATLKAYEKVL